MIKFRFSVASTSDWPPDKNAIPGTSDGTDSFKHLRVNFATSSSRNQMNNSSKDFKPDEDEFILSKLKKKKSKLVRAPSVKDSPVNLECKLVKTIKLKSNSKKISTMIIGEVIGIFIKDKFIKNNRVDSVSMRYIARMGYSEYTTVTSKFNLKRK